MFSRGMAGMGIGGGRGGYGQQKAPDTRRQEACFNEYAEEDESNPLSGPGRPIITEEGTERLCDDLGFSPLDPVALVLCYHCRAGRMGCFTKEEFLQGLAVLGAQDIKELRDRVPEMRSQLQPSHPLSKKIYSNVFVLSLETGQKQLGKEDASELWKLLLPLYGNELLAASWLSYVAEHAKKPAISKDVWNMVFDLLQTCKSDMSDFDEEGAWPLMIDDFADWMKKNNQQG